MNLLTSSLVLIAICLAPTERGKLLGRIADLARLSFPDENQQAELDQLLIEADARFPNDAEILNWSGYRWDRRGKLDQAEAAWRDALRAFEVMPQPKRSELEAMITQRLGFLVLSRGKADEAAALAKRSIAVAPSDIGGYQLLADSALENGKLAELASLLNEAASRPGPAREEIGWLYLDLLAKTGDWNALEEVLEGTPDLNPPTGERHHFLALLAQRSGNRRGEIIHHWIAVENASRSDRWEAESRTRLDQLINVPPAGGVVDPVAEVIFQSRGLFDEAAAEKLAARAEDFMPTSPAEELLRGYAQALASEKLGDSDGAQARWNRILQRWPAFVPALISAADLVEVAGDYDAAVKLRTRARMLRPEHRMVRELYRLGGTFRLVPDGAKVILVEPDGVLEGVGIQPGDVVVALDDQPLAELSPRDQLQRIRQFFGGRVRYRTAAGEELVAELPVQFDEMPVR